MISAHSKLKKILHLSEIFRKASRYHVVTRIFANITKIIYIFTFGLNYIVPTLIVWVSFSKHSPIYLFARATYDYEEHHGRLISVPVNTILSLGTSFSANVITSAYEICLVSIANGILVLYLWSVYLYMHVSSGNHTKSNSKAVLPFDTAIRIYKNLGVMTVLQVDLAKDLITPILHHFYIVIWSTISLYYLLLQFMPGKEVSLVVSACCICMIIGGIVIEMFAICFVANACKMSKKFIRIMKYTHGRNRYRRKVMRGLLPNSINLEFLGSAETMHNGIGRDYFLQYVERVTDSTVSLLLAKSSV